MLLLLLLLLLLLPPLPLQHLFIVCEPLGRDLYEMTKREQARHCLRLAFHCLRG